jgi:hypothetical protein
MFQTRVQASVTVNAAINMLKAATDLEQTPYSAYLEKVEDLLNGWLQTIVADDTPLDVYEPVLLAKKQHTDAYCKLMDLQYQFNMKGAIECIIQNL